MNDNPNYYGILPADVRYSKTISSSAKLLYAEFSALTNKEGYCFASNKYFSNLYDVSERSITAWIKELENSGFLNVELTKNSTGTHRKIFLPDRKNLHTGMKKTSTPRLKKTSNPPEENFYTKEYYKDNNKNNNNNKEYSKGDLEKSQREKVCNYLEDLIFEHSLSELEKFTQQPKDVFFVDKENQHGKDFVIGVLKKINDYCFKNLDYIEKRKSLSGVFYKFAKSHETKLITEVKEKIDETYTKYFGEKYQYSKSDDRHLFELIEKVRQSIQEYNSGEIATDYQISSGIGIMFQKLPDEYRLPAKFKMPLINTNYQQIKLSIKNQTNGSNNKPTDSFTEFLKKGIGFRM
jgi:hypothetical protein